MAISKFLRKLSQIGLTPHDLLHDNFIPRGPLQNRYTADYLSAVRSGNIHRVTEYLNLYKYLGFEYDKFGCTALHWACKKGDFGMAQLIISGKCDVDQEDRQGKTPMYYAHISGNTKVIKLLILNRADLDSDLGKDYDYMEMARENLMNKLLMMKARWCMFLLRIAGVRQRYGMWDMTLNLGIGEV